MVFSIDLNVKGAISESFDKSHLSDSFDVPAGCTVTDIWWSSLETCSNVFIWGRNPVPKVISGGGKWNWSTRSFQGGNMLRTGVLSFLRYFFSSDFIFLSILLQSERRMYSNQTCFSEGWPFVCQCRQWVLN